MFSILSTMNTTIKNMILIALASQNLDKEILSRITGIPDGELQVFLDDLAGKKKIRQKDGLYMIALDENGENPEICNYIEDNETRYFCYSIIAIDKRDPSICEKYFPTNEVLIQEGVNTEHYSKEECIIDAEKGYFN